MGDISHVRVRALLLLALCGISVTVSGQTNFEIHACVKAAAGSTERMRSAIEKSLAAHHDNTAASRIEFDPEGRPCDHTAAMLRDLSAQVDKRYFKGLRNHYFVYLRNDGNPLHIEQFELASEASARRVETELTKQPGRRLVVITESGSTSYEFVRSGRTILFLVAPYRGWTPDTRSIAENIRLNYTAAPQ